MLKILVCGYNHFGFVEAVANGFDQIPDCCALVNTHEHIPVVKTQRGCWPKRFWHTGRNRRLNEKLLEAVGQVRPDLVLCIEGSSMLAETVRRLAAGQPTVLWALDSLRRIGLSHEVLAAFTHVFFFEPSDRSVWPLGRYVPIGFDNRVYVRGEGGEPQHDLVWVGSAHDDRLPRLEAMARFADREGFRFAAYGQFYKPRAEAMFRRDFPALFRAIAENARISPATANRLYNQSRIGVNLHFHDELSQGINPRTFEVLGAGAFMLTDHKPAMETLLDDGKDIGVFHNMDEFEAKAREYLLDETKRAAIAERGHNRAHAEHTFANRAKQILELVLGDLLPGELG